MSNESAIKDNEELKSLALSKAKKWISRINEIASEENKGFRGLDFTYPRVGLEHVPSDNLIKISTTLKAIEADFEESIDLLRAYRIFGHKEMLEEVVKEAKETNYRLENAKKDMKDALNAEINIQIPMSVRDFYDLSELFKSVFTDDLTYKKVYELDLRGAVSTFALTMKKQAVTPSHAEALSALAKTGIIMLTDFKHTDAEFAVLSRQFLDKQIGDSNMEASIRGFQLKLIGMPFEDPAIKNIGDPFFAKNIATIGTPDLISPNNIIHWKDGTVGIIKNIRENGIREIDDKLTLNLKDASGNYKQLLVHNKHKSIEWIGVKPRAVGFHNKENQIPWNVKPK